MSEETFDERSRAEDILLGSLGYGGDAAIVSIEMTPKGYRGVARWEDGESFNFECDEDIDDLQRWALKVLSVSSPCE